MRASFSPARRVLTVQPLEGRIAPAAQLLASLSPTGVLTISGDDEDSNFTLRVNAGNVVLTPDAATEGNNGDPGEAVTLTGVAKSIKAVLNGGADTFLIHGTAPFVLTGALAVARADGNNVLDFTTTGKIDLGSLVVTGGDGTDTVTVAAADATGSRIVKTTLFNFGPGGSTTTLAEVAFGTTVQLTAGDAVGVPNSVDAGDVTVAGAFTAKLGNSFPALVSFTGSTLGGLTASGNAVGASLVNSTVNANVTLKGVYQADLQVEAANIIGGVALTSALASFATTAPDDDRRNLTMIGTGWTTASFQTTTLSEVRNVTVKGAGTTIRSRRTPSSRSGRTWA